MNALKHGFPGDIKEGLITVEYDIAGPNWKLSVSDNGVGGRTVSLLREELLAPKTACTPVQPSQPIVAISMMLPSA